MRWRLIRCFHVGWGEENESKNRCGGHGEKGEGENVAADLGGGVGEDLKEEEGEEADGRALPEELGEGEQEMEGEIGGQEGGEWH